MRSTIFTEILDKTTIEAKTDYQTTVKRLMMQRGFARNTDLKDCPMVFFCDKKGRLNVDNNSGTRRRENRMFYVVGQVREENGKTLVDIYTARDKTAVGFRVACAITFLVALAADVYTMFLDGNNLIQKGALAVAFLLAAIVPLVVDTKNEKKSKDKDLDIMKQAVIDRVNAVDRWDE